MLTDTIKASTLWKNYKGWGSTHPERETFEEIYKAYNQVSVESLLTYGYLLPRKKTDRFFEEVQNLDSTNNILYYGESSFKTVPLVKKYVHLKLTAISSNCDHAFAILDEKSEQIRNIIPYDYSDEGIYNIKLYNSLGEEIPWGAYDWIVDTNSSLLTFNNGIPENISANNPPTLTFYQYAGPVGERHYIDAALFDIENVKFEAYNPVAEFTEQAKDFLDNIEKDFFINYGFNGNDTANGIGLQYNILSNTIGTVTKDPIKGYDDNSDSQVVHLLTHKKGSAENARVLFVSENIANATYTIQVEKAEYSNIYKANLDDGFIIIEAEPGEYKVVVEEDNKVYVTLLVKDNITKDYELFYPREDLDLTIKLPVFTDLMKLPPHLKLTTLNSYTDHITPQYYGPRVADFIIASNEDSVNIRSADYIVYNNERSWLSNAIEASEGNHILLRNGVYENNNNEIDLTKEITLEGEASNTFIKNATIILSNKACVKNIIFKNCRVITKKENSFINCKFLEDSILTIDNSENISLLENCDIESLDISGSAQIFNSRILNLINSGSVSLYNTSVIDNCECRNSKIDINSSFIKNLKILHTLFYINSTRIENLNCISADKNSVITTANINYVENFPKNIKLDSSYVTRFSEKVAREIYPNIATIPYYTSFENRVYAKLPAPFKYNKKTNTLDIALDSIDHTLFINEKGELQVRFFSSKEIYIENPDSIQTQIESIYDEHADTLLNKNKPQTIDEAIIDLYWSKADLKDGKVPIDQLPDSVAYGGLNLVGMWSFEDSNGKYPTFADIATQYSSDDEYTELQNGCFFIVSASHMEDDPVYPQVSEDGEVWTAGDWIIYTGNTHKIIDYSKELHFTFNKNAAKLYSINDDNTITYEVLVKTKRSNSSKDDSSEDSNSQSSSSGSEVIDYGTITVDKNGYITKLYNVKELQVGKLLRSSPTIRVTEAQYKDNTVNNRWQKLDRAYLDPVYSRLPELATKTGDDNPEWSVEDGGTGLLRLSFKSIAEAIRLINDTLLTLSPDRPTSIQLINVILDEERTTAKQQEYIEVDNGLQLSQLLTKVPKKAWNSNTLGSVYFKQKGKREYLPLENCFYCGIKSDIKILDNTEDISKNCVVDKFDPYQRFRLGFRSPTNIDAATINGFVKMSLLGTNEYVSDHNIKYTQYNLQKAAQVTDPVGMLEGESSTLNFLERRFYQLEDIIFNRCEDSSVNLRVLNNLLDTNRNGGFGYLPSETKVTGTFIIDSFTKYGTISPDTKIELKATFNGKDIDVSIDSQTFNLTDKVSETYNLEVSFIANLVSEYCTFGNLEIQAKAISFGVESDWSTILVLKDICVINTSVLPTIVESAGNLIWPSLGVTDTKTQFGADYTNKTANYVVNNPELVLTEQGFGWPKRSRFVNYLKTFDDSTYVNSFSKGIEIGDLNYRFVTFKKSFDKIKDLCGFNLKLNWGSNKPTLDKISSTFENVMIQVCVRSLELDNKNLQNANKPVPVFFEAKFEQAEACNYPGKSSIDIRRITFGRRPIPIKDIYIRIGIAENTDIYIKDIEILND